MCADVQEVPAKLTATGTLLAKLETVKALLLKLQDMGYDAVLDFASERNSRTPTLILSFGDFKSLFGRQEVWSDGATVNTRYTGEMDGVKVTAYDWTERDQEPRKVLL